MPDEPREPPPEPAEHLRIVRGQGNWFRALAPTGLLLIVAAIIITFLAPSALWFLVYPILIIGALAALASVAAWLLRHL